MSLHHADAAAVTYGAASTAVVAWGLNVSDIAVIVSAFAAVAGVALQFYVTLRQIKALQKANAVQAITNAAQAVTNVAQANTNTNVTQAVVTNSNSINSTKK